MAYINEVYEWEGDNTQPYGTNYTWKSKKFLLPVRTTFGAGRVIAEYQDREDWQDSIDARDAIIARNAAKISSGRLGGMIAEDDIGPVDVNGDNLETVPTVADYSGDFNCSLKVYADETLKQTQELYVGRMFRIIGGYRARMWEFQIEGNVIVKRIDIAGSVEELKGMPIEQGG